MSRKGELVACGLIGAVVGVVCAGGVAFHAGYDRGVGHGYSQAIDDGPHYVHYVKIMPAPTPTTVPLPALNDWAQAETLALDIHDVIRGTRTSVAQNPGNVCYGVFSWSIQVTLATVSTTICSRQDWARDKPVLLRLAKTYRSKA